MKIKDTQLDIIQGDITDLNIGAVVNPCGPDRALASPLAGLVLKKDPCRREGGAAPSQVLPAGAVMCFQNQGPQIRYIIHAVKVDDEGKTGERVLRQVCRNVFRCVRELDVDSLAFLPLVENPEEFPVLGAAKIMAQEILKAVRYESTLLRKIVICLPEAALYDVYVKELTSYMNHILCDLGAGPYVTVDIIIEVPEGIVVIERSNPPYGLALPGGFVDPGESLEQAAYREAKEETDLDLVDLRQFHTYSAPQRDPRFHTVSTVFVARGEGVPHFGDDAKGLRVIPREEILKCDFAFDHGIILRDYLSGRKRQKGY